MKIALIGNMNNNNFAIMRYLRDLGADAHLLLWSNDGRGALMHFAPENDTWDIDRWSPYIHQTNLANSILTLLGDPRKCKLPSSSRKIKKQLGGYDAYIGSGYAPAILAKAGISLDIFYPYATGIEGVGAPGIRNYMKNRSWLRRMVIGSIRRKSIDAIINARYCVNAEMSMTKDTFAEIGKAYVPMAVPMVYNREHPTDRVLSQGLRRTREALLRCDIRVLSHCSQTWVRDHQFSPAEWTKCCKHNDWLVRGFASFLKWRNDSNALLALIEYGPDVQATKDLIAELGIEANVMWLPKMSRKELMCLIDACDIGVGEFYLDPGRLWGGTGWEVLASGRPLLQTVNFTNEEFFNTFGHDLPPILDVKCPEDVAKHLNDFMDNKEKYIAIGKQSKDWFETNNGIGLAKKWLALLKS